MSFEFLHILANSLVNFKLIALIFMSIVTSNAYLLCTYHL